MAKKGSRSASKKAQKTAYRNENRGDKNKARKLERHMKKHPNDTQSSKACKGKAVGGRSRSSARTTFGQRTLLLIEKWSKRSEKLMKFDKGNKNG